MSAEPSGEKGMSLVPEFDLPESIVMLRPKPRASLDRIGDIKEKRLKPNRDGERRTVSKTCVTLEITEEVKEKLKHYASSVFKERGGKLMLFGQNETFDSFMPSVAEEDLPAFFGEVIVDDALIPTPEEIKDTGEILQGFAKKVPKKYRLSGDCVIAYFEQPCGKHVLDLLCDRFEELAKTDRQPVEMLNLFAGNESWYTPSVLDKRTIADLTARLAAVTSERDTLAAYYSTSVIDPIVHDTSHVVPTVMEAIMAKPIRWLRAFRQVVRDIQQLVGPRHAFQVLTSPDERSTLVFIGGSENNPVQSYPETLMDLFALCHGAERPVVEDLVRGWLAEPLPVGPIVREGVVLPNRERVLDQDFAIAVWNLFFFARAKLSDVDTVEVLAFVKFLFGRIIAAKNGDLEN